MNDIDLIINKFENQRFSDKENGKTTGVFYTPWNIVDFIVSNSFKLFFEKHFKGLTDPKIKFDPKRMLHLLNEKKNLRNSLNLEINNIKILDPASGSGRFLMATANYLFNIYKLTNENQSDYLIKKKIILDQIYGIDIDDDANIISKLRLVNWLYYGTDSDISKKFRSDLTFSDIRNELSELGVKFKIFNEDYLMDFNQNGFDIILGNPPYVENKKISDPNYKRKLCGKFVSAYKLFDLSVVFIEKSINLLNPKKGILSFLIPNKFLAADYGIKIRKFILKNTQIREIVNISSSNSFKQIATYPIILFLKKGPNKSNPVFIQNIKNFQQINNYNWNQIYSFPQEKIQHFPSFTIPLSDNIELIDNIYSNYDRIPNVLRDLKIIYRPFGFINWANQSKNIIEGNPSSQDMILLGTGNINRYYIDFNKHIKVAGDNYFHPYLRYDESCRDIWKELSREKLVFREIAKCLSFVYDPGIFVNLTGLYFLQVPSFDTDQLFGLLTVLNSKIINTLFKSLFGTLHMSGGYLRFNGSFIKSLPLPKEIPPYFSNLGKILQFLSQLKSEIIKQPEHPQFDEIKLKSIENLLDLYNNLTNDLVSLFYLKHPTTLFSNEYFSSGNLFDFSLKFFLPIYNFPKFEYYTKKEINRILEKIITFSNDIKGI